MQKLLMHTNAWYMKSTDNEKRILIIKIDYNMKTKFRLQKITRYFLYTLLVVVILQSCKSRNERIKDAKIIHPNTIVIKTTTNGNDFILKDTLTNRLILVKDGVDFVYFNNH